MTKTAEVVVAIPNYNMSDQLSSLIPQLLKQGFRHIFILDDNSSETIPSSVQTNSVSLITGEKNLGSAGNRNRIISALEERSYSNDTIIVFLDADTELVDESLSPQNVLKLMHKYPAAGLIGGKVLNSDGSWGAFNYGPLSIRRWLSGAMAQMRIEEESKTNPKKARSTWDGKSSKLLGWPNFLKEPEKTEVGWLVETLTFIRLETFKEVRGYDQSLRYCEALDLGYKLEKMGLKRVFDPSVTVKHLQVDHRGLKRNIEVLSALLKISLKRLLLGK